MSGHVHRVVIVGGAAVAAAFLTLPLAADHLYSAPNGRAIVVKADVEWLLAANSDVMAEKLKSENPKGRDPFDLTSPGAGGPVIPEETKPPSRHDEPPLAALIGADRAFDVRAVRWGMSIAEVKASEQARLTRETPSSLSYRFTKGGLSATIIYTFSAGRLSAVEMAATQKGDSGAAFYDAFDRLTLKLCRIHGAPSLRDYAWSAETYKNDRSKWGLAIGKGQLACTLAWQASRAKINLRASGSAGVFATKIAFTAR